MIAHYNDNGDRVPDRESAVSRPISSPSEDLAALLSTSRIKMMKTLVVPHHTELDACWNL